MDTGNIQKDLYIESSIWGAICLIALLSRLTSKFIQLKSKSRFRFQLDDCIMLIAFCFYIAAVVSINVFATHNILFLQPELQLISAQNMTWTIKGYKLSLVIEITMLTCVWGVKMCLLILYLRLTSGLTQAIVVKAIMIYVITSYIVLVVLLLGILCRPLDRYWSLAPPTNLECLTYRKYFITDLSLNISSDLFTIAVPWSFLARLKLERSKKYLLMGVFSLGIFVIVSACLTKYYSITPSYNPHWEFWYISEASTAILVGNIPLCLPLIKKVTSRIPVIHYLKRSIRGSTADDLEKNESVTSMQDLAHRG